MRELFVALASLHRLGLVHGGIKPSNVLVTEDDERVMLLDAIISRTQLGTADPRLDPDDVRYLSPEQAGLVHRTVGFAADLYAAGWVLVESFAELGKVIDALPTNRTALCESPGQLARALRSAGVPRSLIPLFRGLMAPMPEDRFTDADGMVAAIDRLSVAADRESRGSGGFGLAQVAIHDDADPPLVGRGGELARLVAAADGARAGHPAVVCLIGDSGLGKTRLLDTLESHAVGHGMRVLRGGAFDHSAKRPLRLFQGIFAELVKYLAHHPAETTRIAVELDSQVPSVLTLVPELAEVFGATEGGEATGGEGDTASIAVAALARLFELLCSPHWPGLLVLDDCQWADELSWSLLATLAEVAGRSEKLHLAVVCSMRTEAWPKARSWSPESPPAVRLTPLSEAACRSLLSGAASHLPEEIIDYVVAQAEGNPLYALSTLRALIDSSVLRADGERWVVDAGLMDRLPGARSLDMAEGGSQQRPQSFVSARLDQLTEDTRRAVRQAAILGRTFSVTLLSATLDREVQATWDAIGDAARRGLLRPLPAQGQDHVEFAHDRIRDAVLDSLDEPTRTSAHAAAARALIARSTQPLTDLPPHDYEIAYHLDRSARAEEALPYALRAGEEALARNALDIARTNFSIAASGLDKTEAATENRVRFRVFEGLGTVHMLAGRYDIAASELEQAYRIAAGLGRPELGRVATLLTELAFKRGSVVDAQQWTIRAMDGFGLRMPRGRAGAGLASLAESARLLGFLVARRFGVIRRNRAHAGQTVAARLFIRFGYLAWFTRSPLWNVWSSVRGLRQSYVAGSVRELSHAFALAAAVLAGLVPALSPIALRLADQSMRLRRQARDSWGIAHSHHFRGFVLHAARRYPEAIAEFDSAIASFETLGDRWEQIAAKWQKALCLYRQGRIHDAGALARDTFWEGKRIGDLIGAGTALAIWVRCLPGEVSPETMERELARLSADHHTTALGHAAAGWNLLHRGDFDGAGAALRLAEEHRRSGGVRNHFLAPVTTAQLHAARLSWDAVPRCAVMRRRMSLRSVRRMLSAALFTTLVFGAERPAVLREWAQVSLCRGRVRSARLQLRLAMRAARRSGAEGELAACCHIAELAFGTDGRSWRPLDGLPSSEEVCRRLRLRVDRGFVEALSLKVLPDVGDVARHRAVLESARRIVTSEDTGQILEAVRAAAASITTALDVSIVAAPAEGLPTLSEDTEIVRGTERVIKLITTSGPVRLAVAVELPLGEAANHEQSVEVLATLAGAVLERQELRTESAQRIVAVQEAERGRIARDLHDELGHLFAGVLDGLSVLTRSAGAETAVDARVVDGIRALAHQGIRSVRTVAWTLRPEGLDDLGVVGCVEQLVEDCERMFRIRIDLTTRVEAVELPVAVETAVFRIIQEALTNIGRHSAASEASVLLVASADQLRAVVEDNGVGFETAAPRGSLGLTGMTERARLVGGRLEIESQPGTGTTVMVEVPIG
jgi:two-component system sensor kinase